MASETKKKPVATEITAEQVIEYLEANPSFFDQHPDLLINLRVPHPTGTAVSLIEKQVEVLRNSNRKLDRKLIDLVDVARANDAATDRIHQLTLVIVNATDLHDLLTSLQDKLRNRFNADFIAILLFVGDSETIEGSPALRIDRDDPQLEHLQSILNENKAVCGRLRPQQLDALFGDDANEIGSTALVPLGQKSELGLLAISSRSEDQFGPNLGVSFLKRISELLSARLGSLLDE